MKSILVIGGAGYIGSHACKALSKAGYRPVTYDNLVYGHEWAVKWGPFVKGDLNDRAALLNTFARFDIAGIIHFAAFAYVGESMTNPGLYFRNNTAGTLTLLETMQEAGLDRIVFSSTCATYGMPERVPITENVAQHPVNPYGESKLMVEKLLYWFGVAHNLKSIALRYFNAAGADVDGEIGEAHDPETHLIPLILDAASGRRKHIGIYGTDYATPDGTAIRDYIHVADLADAHVKAIRSLLDGGESGVFNLGTGYGHSVREVIASVERVTGRTVSAERGSTTAG